MSLLLVAEQDENGELAWVWHWRSGFNAAKPLTRLDEIQHDLDCAECHGATLGKKRAWIGHCLVGREMPKIEGYGTDAKIKSIVFDLGGVLFTEGKSVALKALIRDHGYDPAIINEILNCPLSRDMRKGLISEAAFWSWAEGQLPESYDVQTIKNAWYEGYALDQDVFDLARRLKGRYKLAVFSENIPDRIAFLDQRYGFRELFDVEVYSYDHQAGKRDPEFLEILLSTLDNHPHQILYIDNSKKVVDLAERQGLEVVHYTTGQMARIEATMRRLGIFI